MQQVFICVTHTVHNFYWLRKTTLRHVFFIMSPGSTFYNLWFSRYRSLKIEIIHSLHQKITWSGADLDENLGSCLFDGINSHSEIELDQKCWFLCRTFLCTFEVELSSWFYIYNVHSHAIFLSCHKSFSLISKQSSFKHCQLVYPKIITT